MNNNTVKIISQYNLLTDSKLSQLFLADPFQWVVYNLSFEEKRLFDLLVWADNTHQFSRFSQTHLAEKIGVARETINRMLAKFKRFGLISFKQLGYNMPCIYRLHSYFRTINARDCLQAIIPSIKKRVFKFLDTFLTNRNASHYDKELILNLNVNVNQNCFIKKNVGQNMSRRREKMTFEEKKRVFEEMKNGNAGVSPITSTIDGFKSLTLTTAGMVDLTAYTDEVVAYADHVLSTKYGFSNFDNPFGYVIRICKNRSAELGLPVQVAFAHKLREFYGIELSAPKYQPIARTFAGSYSSQPIQRQKTQDHQGDKQAFNAHVETMTSVELRAAIDQELAKNQKLIHSSNPYQLVGADGHKILAWKKRLATLEGERPSSLPTPCQDYAQALFLLDQPVDKRLAGPMAEMLKAILVKSLPAKHQRCNDYCGQADYVNPAPPVTIAHSNTIKNDIDETIDDDPDGSYYFD